MALSKYYPSICLEGLTKTTGSSRLTGVPGEIQTERLQNMNLKLTQSGWRRGRIFKMLHGHFHIDDVYVAYLEEKHLSYRIHRSSY
jgi:hypothetical protein